MRTTMFLMMLVMVCLFSACMPTGSYVTSDPLNGSMGTGRVNSENLPSSLALSGPTTFVVSVYPAGNAQRRYELEFNVPGQSLPCVLSVVAEPSAQSAYVPRTTTTQFSPQCLARAPSPMPVGAICEMQLQRFDRDLRVQGVCTYPSAMYAPGVALAFTSN